MATFTAPSRTVAPFDKGRLSAGILAADTTIYVGAIYKTVNGVRTKQGFDTTSGECLISQGEYSERISYSSKSVNSTTFVTTLSGCTRGLPVTNTTPNYTGGTGRAWPKGASIKVIDSHSYDQDAAYQSTTNTFTDHQTIAVNKELRLADSASAIWDDGSDINFKSSAQATRTLSQLASLSGSNDKVKVTSNDTTEDYLYNKLAAGAGITVTETNDGGNEDATIAAVNTVATGHTGLSTVTSGGILIGNGTGNMTIIGPGSNGQVPVSNGTTIAMGNACVPMYISTADSNDISTNTTAADWNTSYSITGNTLSVGSCYEIEAWGLANGGTTTRRINVGLNFGSTVLFTFGAMILPNSSNAFHVRCRIICRSTGATGTVLASGELTTIAAVTDPVVTTDTCQNVKSPTVVTVDTTATSALKLTNYWNINDGSGKSSLLNSVVVTKLA